MNRYEIHWRPTQPGDVRGDHWRRYEIDAVCYLADEAWFRSMLGVLRAEQIPTDTNPFPGGIEYRLVAYSFEVLDPCSSESYSKTTKPISDSSSPSAP